MSDPDGLTREQRELLNAVHQAVVVSSAIRMADRAAGHDQGTDHDDVLRRSKAAIAAAEAAGVSQAVVHDTARRAISIGHERANR